MLCRVYCFEFEAFAFLTSIMSRDGRGASNHPTTYKSMGTPSLVTSLPVVFLSGYFVIVAQLPQLLLGLTPTAAGECGDQERCSWLGRATNPDRPTDSLDSTASYRRQLERRLE